MAIIRDHLHALLKWINGYFNRVSISFASFFENSQLSCQWEAMSSLSNLTSNSKITAYIGRSSLPTELKISVDSNYGTHTGEQTKQYVALSNYQTYLSRQSPSCRLIRVHMRPASFVVFWFHHRNYRHEFCYICHWKWKLSHFFFNTRMLWALGAIRAEIRKDCLF